MEEPQEPDASPDASGFVPGAQVLRQAQARRDRVRSRLRPIRHKIAVLGGKGGVGKSQVTVNLASVLALDGFRTGILDADLNGSSIADMVGVDAEPRDDTRDRGSGFLGIRVGSMGILQSRTKARGPGRSGTHPLSQSALEASVLGELISDSAWGRLDYLLIDMPPASLDTVAAVADWIPELDGALLVTVPSAISHKIAQRTYALCQDLGVPVLGVVENMSHWSCPECRKKYELFSRGGEVQVFSPPLPRIASIPFDPRMVVAADAGWPFVSMYPRSAAAKAFTDLGRHLVRILDMKKHVLGRL